MYLSSLPLDSIQPSGGREGAQAEPQSLAQDLACSWHSTKILW